MKSYQSFQHIVIGIAFLTVFFHTIVHIYHVVDSHNVQETGRVMTVNDCVIQKWSDWESDNIGIPSSLVVKGFHNMCWEEFGAVIHN